MMRGVVSLPHGYGHRRDGVRLDHATGLPGVSINDLTDPSQVDITGNAVLRWEYRPGSTIFLVWQRQQDDEVGVGDFRFRRDLDALWRAPAHNRFLVKVNYWFGL